MKIEEQNRVIELIKNNYHDRLTKIRNYYIRTFILNNHFNDNDNEDCVIAFFVYDKNNDYNNVIIVGEIDNDIPFHTKEDLGVCLVLDDDVIMEYKEGFHTHLTNSDSMKQIRKIGIKQFIRIKKMERIINEE